MAWTLDTPGSTSWALDTRGSTDWGLEAGSTFWPPDDELWAPWTDGSWWLDHDGAFVGWADWPPSWYEPPPSTGDDPLTGALLTDELGNPLTDELGNPLLYS